MTDDFEKARTLLRQFKGDAYLFGVGVLSEAGKMVAQVGKRAALVRSAFAGSDDYVRKLQTSLREASVDLLVQIKGPRPNVPREDLYRIADELKRADPDVVISFGGGSTIDATKAAEVLCTLGGPLDDYFGTGLVSASLAKMGRSLRPHVAIQTAASSAAHLTKYSNVTDLATGQKKLIIDDAIVPILALFDYEVTYDAPPNLTADGAMDGLSHALEVLYGAVGKPYYDKASEITEVSITLIVQYLPKVLADPSCGKAREAMGLATDLGGYAIMIGGTNGGHLTSFSLVDILPHGRACAILNPYYTVFFASAIEQPLRRVGRIYQRAGLTEADLDNLSGRELGIAIAEAMFELARRIGYPTRLHEVEGFSKAHIERALMAAKNPQLKMKLQNMPVPLNAETVDMYMRPTLEAAAQGNLALIQNMCPGTFDCGMGGSHTAKTARS
jgi:alcohol dehydrogenase